MKWSPGNSSGQIVTAFGNFYDNPTDVVLDSSFLFITTTSSLVKWFPDSTLEREKGNKFWGISI